MHWRNIRRGHDVADGIDLLESLEHRGTTGAEANTGDGAGVLLQSHRDFFADELDVDLPDTYAVGAVFLPDDDAAREPLRERTEATFGAHDLSVLAWRDVPRVPDAADVGATARDSEPDVRGAPPAAALSDYEAVPAEGVGD